jgi:molybdopterin converting factor small subunit
MAGFMKALVSVFGPEVILRQEIDLERPSIPIRDLFRSLSKGGGEKWDRVLRDDHTPVEAYVVLVNGRNIKSLQGLETEIHAGDEVVFTVLLSGG